MNQIQYFESYFPFLISTIIALQVRTQKNR